jgi:hypothetical protein
MHRIDTCLLESQGKLYFLISNTVLLLMICSILDKDHLRPIFRPMGMMNGDESL